MAARALAVQTIATRAKRINQLSRELKLSLAEVTAEALLLWTATKQWRTRNAQRNYHQSVRLFLQFECPELAGVIPAIRQPQAVPRPAPESTFTRGVETSDQRQALVLRLARESGLRRQEIACLRHASDIAQHPDGWWVSLVGKGARHRRIPISESLASAVFAWASTHEAIWLFPGFTQGHLSPSWVGKLARRAMDGEATLHQLRHSYATAAYAGSLDVIAVQHLLGHSSVATTQQYVAVVGKSLRRAAQAADPSRRPYEPEQPPLPLDPPDNPEPHTNYSGIPAGL